jgi:hypothetical protein
VTTLAAEAERPAPLRLAMNGLWLELGHPNDHAYRVLLEPAVARQLAADLLFEAAVAERHAQPILAELAELNGSGWLAND